MNRLLVVLLGWSILTAGALRAQGAWYPHVGTNGVSCPSCHVPGSSEPLFLPPWTVHPPADIDDTQHNTLCLSCHNEIVAPAVKTHSSLTTSNKYGNWTIECRSCHSPHYQEQYRSHGSAAASASGTWLQATGNRYKAASAVWTVDSLRDLILIPDCRTLCDSLKIASNTADEIEVPSSVVPLISAGGPFSIVYDKLILAQIRGPNTEYLPARFFRKTGSNSFADGDGTYDGVCEVCHTKTAFHRNNASGDHSHLAAANCTECHNHRSGFRGMGAGSHSAHASAQQGPSMTCATGALACHGTYYPPPLADGQPLEATASCTGCHSQDGISGAKAYWEDPGSSTNPPAASSWADREGDSAFCGSCHDSTPGNTAMNGSGRPAQNVMGDRSTYGFSVTGHGKPSGNYPKMAYQPTGAAGNPAANRRCRDCHETVAQHFGSTGSRLKTGYENDQANSGCSQCHEPAGGARHDPTLYQGSAQHETTPHGGLLCTQCHEVHGAVPGRYPAMARNEVRALCLSCHNATPPNPPSAPIEPPLAHNASSTIPCSRCHNPHSPIHGAGAIGDGCVECHGHDAGYEYAAGKYSMGTGTFASHSAHTENDSDDARGPFIGCGDCHDTNNFPRFKSGTDADHDGVIELSETDVCTTCHSPGGTYDGVNNPVYGAKANWEAGVYQADGKTLQPGKEKWCPSCHDESPSVMRTVSAPNVIGNEAGAYAYGMGWGYYKTGHGLPSSQSYPASGGLTGGAGVECGGCHDSAVAHIDGLARTFEDGESNSLDPSYYRQGYRLKMVAAGQGTGASGREPMLVPAPGTTANSANNYRLCVSCHAPSPYIDPGNVNTNLRNATTNLHEYHLRSTGLGQRTSADWSNAACVGGSMGACNSRITCTTCHNVHGSTRLAMVNDGKLVNREPGSRYWYYNPNMVSFNSPPDTQPTPVNLPLTSSTGIVWSAGSSSYICSNCHGNAWLVTEDRTPFQDVGQTPILSWAGSAGYESDGVEPNTAGGGSNFTFRVKYTDGNNDPPSVYQVWIDKNDNGACEADEKLDMAALDPADQNYSDGKIYTFATALFKQGDGTLRYLFHFQAGTDQATGAPTADSQVAVTNGVPALSWTGETNYATDGVHPDTGGNGSSFTFRVKYSDQDNEAPDTDGVRVVVNGAYYTLDPEAGGSFATGKIYSTAITLSTPGALGYRFTARDPAGASATGDPAADHIVTVLASSNNPPVLSWASAVNCLTEGVRPRTGAINADFEFRVTYSDMDGQCPTYTRITVNGTAYDLTGNDGASCQTGRTYYRTIALAAAGDLNYAFSASDGTDAAIGAPTANRIVSVVNTPYKVRPEGGSGWYSTVAAAISASSDPSVILVYPNADFTAHTYPEGGITFSSKPNRTLQSACGRDLTTVSGGTNVITVGSTNVIVDGFSISDGTSYGVYFNSSSAMIGTVKSSKISSNATGLYLNQNSTVTIEDSLIENNSTRGINTPLVSSVLKIYRSTISDNNPTAASVTGAGISFSSGSGTHVIEDCIISNNKSIGHGGGIYIINGSQITIRRSTIKNNSGASGGGIFSNSGSPTLTISDTFIQGNSASSNGGGINVNTGTATLTNVVLTGNKSTLNGGAIYSNSPAGPPAIDCVFSTISGNYANAGGGIYRNAGTVAVKNSIIYNNDAATQQLYKQLFAQTSGWQNVDVYSTLINQVPSDSTYPFGYEDMGGNNTTDNPNFETPIANPSADDPTTAGNFRIQSGSPAINAASPTWTSDHDIFDNTPDSRPKGGAYDIGAHEKE